MKPDEKNETAPPAIDPDTGVALVGGYPLNHRLRAEALAQDGKAEDPDGVVSPELIADASARMKRDAQAEVNAQAKADVEVKARAEAEAEAKAKADQDATEKKG